MYKITVLMNDLDSRTFYDTYENAMDAIHRTWPKENHIYSGAGFMVYIETLRNVRVASICMEPLGSAHACPHKFI